VRIYSEELVVQKIAGVHRAVMLQFMNGKKIHLEALFQLYCTLPKPDPFVFESRIRPDKNRRDPQR
jgi:hypothetical protein